MHYRLMNLDTLTEDGLAQAFSKIPAGATTLDLSRNHLDFKTGAELAIIFAMIPPHVKIKNFSEQDGLEEINEARLKDRFFSLFGDTSANAIISQDSQETGHSVLPVAGGGANV